MIELTDDNYNSIISTDKPIFIDFYSPGCGPCQTLSKIMEIVDKYAEDKDILICKCNTFNNQKIAKKYMIRSVPMTCVVDLDKNIKDVEIGLKDQSYYISIVDKYTKKKNKGFFGSIFG